MTTKKAGKARNGKLTKKEMKELASTNQKLNCGSVVDLSSQEEIVTALGLGQQEGAEDGSGVSKEPAANPEPDQSAQLAGKGSSHEDQKEQLDSQRSPPRGMSTPINKLIKSYKKSRNATKTINKIKNKIKKNKKNHLQIQCP